MRPWGKREAEITILWVVQNVMCLPVLAYLQVRAVFEITNENGYIAENSGEKNSGNTDKKKNPKTSTCLEMGELPASSNKSKFS